MVNKGAESAVKRTAKALRLAAMSAEEGAFLGSEELLMARLGVSRATLRQAAGLVEQEQLLAVRRGVGGGYFARKPEVSTVIRIAAIYLQSRKAGLDDMIAAVEPIRTELARLASRNRDPEKLAKLQAFLDEERALDAAGFTYQDYLKSEQAFEKVLGETSGNEVLTLFLDIIYGLAWRRRHEDALVQPERIKAYRAQRNRMAEAIAEGDEEIAVLASRRCSVTLMEWMKETTGGRSFSADIGETHKPLRDASRTGPVAPGRADSGAQPGVRRQSSRGKAAIGSSLPQAGQRKTRPVRRKARTKSTR